MSPLLPSLALAGALSFTAPAAEQGDASPAAAAEAEAASADDPASGEPTPASPVDTPAEAEPEQAPPAASEPPTPTPAQPTTSSGNSAPGGGFGQVGPTTVESQVRAPPPPAATPSQTGEGEEEGPRLELSARAEIGYAQTDLGNAQPLDHQGLYLRVHLAAFPWLTRSRRVGAGLGAAYTYTGLNRGELPESVAIDGSSAQQQALTLGAEFLFRPHPEWFSIQLSPMLGLGWYANATELFAAGRATRISPREYAFVSGGTLALCTAWGIACVSGGAEYFLAVTTASASSGVATINPWGWHVGLGVDVMRIMARANRTPQ